MEGQATSGSAGAGVRAGAGNLVSGGEFLGSLVQARSIGSLTLVEGPPPARRRPRQLPPAQGLFVNRTEEIALLESLATGALTGGAAGLVVLSGLGGVGKTQLVAQWAARRQTAFPDGQLYVDLADVRHDGAVDVSAVLGTFLRALGVPDSETGGSLAERTAAFRTCTAAHDLLVVIDNAQHPSEVRPFLPARGLVVATSRRELAALRMDGAQTVTVRPLQQDAATELFRGWLGEERGATPALSALVELCGGLPLALRAVGRRLLDGPHLSIEQVVTELADERGRLRRMTDDASASGSPMAAAGEEATVEAALDSTYATLPEHARTLYLLLGVLPGTTFSTALLRCADAPDLVDAPRPADAPQLADALGVLVAGHMAVEVGEGRYRLHDLVRAHARLRAEDEGGDAWRERVLGRFVDYYRTWAAAADRAVLGNRYRLSEVPDEPAFPDSATALAWLDAERSNLLALVRAAARDGRHDAVWRLCESLWALYHSRKHVGDWIQSHRIGIESAQWEGRTDAEIRLRNQLARAHMEDSQHGAAEAELARAAELLGLVRDPRLAGMVRETQGLLRLAGAEPEEAVALFQRAKEANEQTGDRHGVVVQSYNLGQALLASGRPLEAERVLHRAYALAVRTLDDAMRSRIGIVQGRVQRALGRQDEALRQTLNAAHWAARHGQRAKLGQALAALLELAEEVGDGPTAAACRDKIEALRPHADAPDPA